MAGLLILLLLFFPSIVHAEDVVINEFLIDPQPQQVELFNKGSSTVDISNWYIDDNGGTTYFTIPSSTLLPSQSCVVFSADFNLNKSSSDTIRLFNNTAIPTSSTSQLQDSFTYDKSQGTNISYFRSSDGQENWISGSPSFGKTNTTNTSCIYIMPTPSPTVTSAVTITPTVLPTNIITPTSELSPIPSISYTNVYISEVMPYPETNQKEWVEIYNSNSFSVSLTNWYVDDIDDGGSSPKIFSLNLDPYSYGVIEISSLFNNDEDDVRLLDNTKLERDKTSYSDPIQGQSWGKKSDSTFCYQLPSKNIKNNECFVMASTAIPIPTSLPTPTIQTPTIPLQIMSTISPTQQASPSATYITPFSARDNSITAPMSNSHQKERGEVLAAKTYKTPDPIKKAAVNSLSFASFSFSILSIISLVLKARTMA
jgi:hypothetical protein